MYRINTSDRSLACLLARRGAAATTMLTAAHHLTSSAAADRTNERAKLRRRANKTCTASCQVYHVFTLITTPREATIHRWPTAILCMLRVCYKNYALYVGTPRPSYLVWFVNDKFRQKIYRLVHMYVFNEATQTSTHRRRVAIHRYCCCCCC